MYVIKPGFAHPLSGECTICKCMVAASLEEATSEIRSIWRRWGKQQYTQYSITCPNDGCKTQIILQLRT